MTSRQMEIIADNALSAMAKRKAKEFDNRTIPHPANKDEIKAFRDKWHKKGDAISDEMERKLWEGYYDDKPDEYQKVVEERSFLWCKMRIG